MATFRLRGAPRPAFLIVLAFIAIGAWRHFHASAKPMLDTEWAGAAPPVCTASVPWSIERLDPFRREKSLGFELREAQSVEISIFDAAGDLVFRSSPSMFPAGRFDLAWSGFDHRGRPARPGFYFARWSFANSWTARRLLLIGVP